MQVGVHACTDITGFGLLGHLKGMMVASGVGAQVYLSEVPLLPGTWRLAEQGIAPGGTERNLASLGSNVQWDSAVPDVAKVVLSDAQTSGGLLISVAPDKERRLIDELTQRGVPVVAVIGRVAEESPGVIRVLA